MTVRDESIHDDGRPCHYIAGACNLCGATNPDKAAHDWDGCLMCAVRALTEGRPRDWAMVKDLPEGASVSGVVMRQGEQPSHFESRVPFMDLWLGGIERVRVAGHGMSLREALLAAEIQVGDTVTVTFEGAKEIESGKFKGKPFKLYSVHVERGHH